MIFSDHLSHNTVAGDSSNQPICEGLDLKNHDVYLNDSDDKCLSLAAETDKDPMMQALNHQIIKGWPHIRSECGEDLQDYWNYRDELSVLDGLVLKGSCIAIPESCRDEILDQLHEGHFGIDRTKLGKRFCLLFQYKQGHSVLLKCVICAKNTHRDIIHSNCKEYPHSSLDYHSDRPIYIGWSVIPAGSRCNLTVPSGENIKK